MYHRFFRTLSRVMNMVSLEFLFLVVECGLWREGFGCNFTKLPLSCAETRDIESSATECGIVFVDACGSLSGTVALVLVTFPFVF